MTDKQYQLSRIANTLDGIRSDANLALEWFKSRFGQAITKADLEKLETTIMSAISEFADRQNAFNDRLEAAITDLTGDVEYMTEQIEAFQGSSGAITPEDQQFLNNLEARNEAMTAKLEALAAVTPPKPPV